LLDDVNTADLHRLARVLRDIALSATSIPGAQPVSAGTTAIVDDVSRNPSSAIGDIADRTGLAQSLVSKTVAKLRERGLLTTHQDPRDARRTLVSVAPGACVGAYVPDRATAVDDGIRALFPGITDARLNRILLGLSVLGDEVLGHRVEWQAAGEPAR
jgi:DNA-binding transcriptional ArsR family regulator